MGLTCLRTVAPNNRSKKETEFYSNLNVPERYRLWGLLCLLVLMFSVIKTVVKD